MAPRPATVPTRAWPRRAWALLLAAVGLGFLLAQVPASPASAHAELETSSPADDSVVKAPPARVSLQFSEGVSVRPDGVRVLDDQGERVDRGQAKASGGVVTAALEADLHEGSYQVAWRAVSADGHPVSGAFTFSVGRRTTLDSGLASQAFGGGSDRPYEIAGAVLRGLAYIGTLGAAGMVVLGGLLHRHDEPSPVSRLAGALAGLGLVAVLLQIPIQATLATGLGAGAIGEPGVFRLAIADGVGWAALVTVLGLVGILIAVGLPFTGLPRAIAVGGAALAPLGFAITGHTRTMSPAAVAYIEDVVHLLAGAAWFGGLIAVVTVVNRRRRQADEHGAAEAIASFSGWAGLILAAVIVAGTALAWIEVGSWNALTTTTYGQLLLVKVGLVTLVALGAAWNRFKLVPIAREAEADADPSVRAWTTLTRIVRFEAVGIAVILGLTGVLVNVTPARTAVSHGPVTAEAPLGGGRMVVTIDPARPGRNDVHVYLYRRNGAPDPRFKTIEMAFRLPALELGPLKRTPVHAAPGHFQLVGTELAPGGQWTLTVTVKPDRFTEQKATVTFRIR